MHEVDRKVFPGIRALTHEMYDSWLMAFGAKYVDHRDPGEPRMRTRLIIGSDEEHDDFALDHWSCGSITSLKRPYSTPVAPEAQKPASRTDDLLQRLTWYWTLMSTTNAGSLENVYEESLNEVPKALRT